ncbi:MAG TPA: vitamin K epoxide reductase family protein [Candidatus Nanopelagicales bacterium]
MSIEVQPAPPVAPDAPAASPARTSRGWWWAMLVASLLGIASGTITVVEKIALLAEPGRSAICDVNGAIGCTPVLLAPQSSVLGPPNAALGIVMFGMLAAAGLAGVMGTAFPRSYRWFLLGLSTFFGLFLTWYMWQVGFVIGSLCPFCAVCAGSVMVTTLAAWRTATVDVPHSTHGLGGALAAARRSGLDVIVIVGWSLLIAGVLVVGIAL